jgi:hypothetical protein
VTSGRVAAGLPSRCSRKRLPPTAQRDRGGNAGDDGAGDRHVRTRVDARAEEARPGRKAGGRGGAVVPSSRVVGTTPCRTCALADTG